MAQNRPNRLPILATILFTVAVVTAGTLSSAGTDIANAQDQSSATGHAIQTPPPVPGIEYTTDGTGTVPSAAPALTGATPAAPVDSGATTAPGAPVEGGTITASLGGSDIAVSSVGGSYEVDGPRRRAKRGHRD
ncbi:MAG: hypothetical protein ACRDJC_01320 [Thermomicrobiales bacterium]